MANCVLLDRQCHSWAHLHPLEAQRDGFIVKANGNANPADVPVKTWWGWVRLTDSGAYGVD